jgi:superfamily II DNA or RNA helicase
MNDNPLVADVVDTWLRRAQNRPTFCFAVDRAHAKHLQAKFAEAGVSTGYIDAYTPINERTEIKAAIPQRPDVRGVQRRVPDDGH